jgi:nucleotide-binding universal stress UspA family protein
MEDMMAKRILVPVATGHETAAVAVAGSVAREQGATVRLIKVLPVPERVVGPYGRTIAYVDQEMERLTAKAREEMELAESQLHDVPVETIVRFGEPVEEILLEADAFGADLITVTTARRHRAARAVRPDVADRLLQSSPVPVLLLRE